MHDDQVPTQDRPLRLRYPSRCNSCQADLPAKTTAIYSPQTKLVTCLACADGDTTHALQAALAPHLHLGDGEGATAQGEEQSSVVGQAGASARREHERRRQRREDRVRARHPRLGGVILALTDEAQSTKAWAKGARGEELLAGRLDAAAGPTLRLLHDRRIPGSKANIDHVAVTPTGVYVIDAKRYQGKPRLQIDGGLLRARTEKLLVGRRDCTHLVAGATRQVNVIRDLLRPSHPDVPVHGVLCFVEADWPLIGGDFTINDINVIWPKKLQQALQMAGPLSEQRISTLHGVLASQLKSA